MYGDDDAYCGTYDDTGRILASGQRAKENYEKSVK